MDYSLTRIGLAKACTIFGFQFIWIKQQPSILSFHRVFTLYMMVFGSGSILRKTRPFHSLGRHGNCATCINAVKIFHMVNDVRYHVVPCVTSPVLPKLPTWAKYFVTVTSQDGYLFCMKEMVEAVLNSWNPFERKVQAFLEFGGWWNMINFVQKNRSIMLRKDEQALQPIVGNFDTLGEATSEEKALLWWEKRTPKAVV